MLDRRTSCLPLAARLSPCFSPCFRLSLSLSLLGTFLLLAAVAARAEDATRSSLHLRGQATAEQRFAIESLKDRIGGEVAVRFLDDGTLRYLAAEDIAPD